MPSPKSTSSTSASSTVRAKDEKLRKRILELISTEEDASDDTDATESRPASPTVKRLKSTKDKILDYLGDFLVPQSTPRSSFSTAYGVRDTRRQREVNFPHAIRMMINAIYDHSMKEDTVLTRSFHPALEADVFKYSVTVVHPCSVDFNALQKASTVPYVVDVSLEAGGDESIIITHTVCMDSKAKAALEDEREAQLMVRKLKRSQKEITKSLPLNESEVLYNFVKENVELLDLEKDDDVPRGYKNISQSLMQVCWPLQTGTSVSFKQLVNIKKHYWVVDMSLAVKKNMGMCLFVNVEKKNPLPTSTPVQ